MPEQTEKNIPIASFSTLPDEILLCVIRFLPVQSLLQLFLVSKRLARLREEPSIWEALYKKTNQEDISRITYGNICAETIIKNQFHLTFRFLKIPSLQLFQQRYLPKNISSSHFLTSTLFSPSKDGEYLRKLYEIELHRDKINDYPEIAKRLFEKFFSCYENGYPLIGETLEHEKLLKIYEYLLLCLELSYFSKETHYSDEAREIIRQHIPSSESYYTFAFMILLGMDKTQDISVYANKRAVDSIPHEFEKLDRVLEALNTRLFVEMLKEITQGERLPHYSGLDDAERIFSAFNRSGNGSRIASDNEYFTRLPKAIKWLTALEHLSLSENNFLKLPHEIGELLNLKNLALDNCNVISLPMEIGKLIKLQKISFADNDLTFLPDEIGNLIELQEANFAINDLFYLPLKFRCLQKLSEINLNANDFSSIPDAVFFLKKLKTLSMENNRICYISPGLKNLVDLNDLWLEGNDIEVIPPFISRLSRLRSFHIRNNMITELPKELTQLSLLNDFGISGNPYSHVSDSIKTFFLSNNRSHDMDFANESNEKQVVKRTRLMF